MRVQNASTDSMGGMAVVGRAEVKIVADARGFSRQAERAVNRQLRDVDVDANPIRNGIAQGLTGATVQRAVTRSGGRAARGWLTQFGIVLQGGISPRAAGALGGVVLAGLLPALTVAGTLAGGALVTAFGAAIAAIPLIVTAQNETVQRSFAGAFRRIGNTLREISQPFVSTWISIMGTMTDTFEAFAGPLEDAFAELGGPSGPIAQFVNNLGEAFEELIPTIGPLTDAFAQILEDLGPELRDDVFPGLARAIINVSDSIGSSDNFVQLIGWLFGLIEGTINFFAAMSDLGNWFTDNQETFQPIINVFGILFDFLGPLVTEVIRLIENLITSEPVIIAVTALLLLLALPIIVLSAVLTELIGWINDFIEAMGGAENRVSRVIESIGQWFADFGADVADIWSGLVANVESAVAQLGRYWDNLQQSGQDLQDAIRRNFNNVVNFFRRLPGRIAGAAGDLWGFIWDGFKSAINSVIRAWNGVSFPSITVGGQDPLGPFGPSIPTTTIGGWNLPNIPYLQTGGLIAEAGVARVGEAGPETVFLPQGAQVDPRPAERIVAESDRQLPDEFEATATIDLGNDIQRAVNLTFRRVATNARAGQRRTAATV